MSICLDCTTSPSRLCPIHHATDNHDEPEDFEMLAVNLRRALAAKQNELDAMRKTVAEVSHQLLLLLAREARK